MAPVGVNAPCRQLPAGSAPLAPSQRLCILFYGPKCLANILTRYMAVLRDSLAAWKQPQPAQRWRPPVRPVGCRRPGAPADMGRKQAQLARPQTPRCTLTPNSIARSNIEKFGRETIKRVCAGVPRELFARVCARGSLKAALGLLLRQRPWRGARVSRVEQVPSLQPFPPPSWSRRSLTHHLFAAPLLEARLPPPPIRRRCERTVLKQHPPHLLKSAASMPSQASAFALRSLCLTSAGSAQASMSAPAA